MKSFTSLMIVFLGLMVLTSTQVIFKLTLVVQFLFKSLSKMAVYVMCKLHCIMLYRLILSLYHWKKVSLSWYSKSAWYVHNKSYLQQMSYCRKFTNFLHLSFWSTVQIPCTSIDTVQVTYPSPEHMQSRRNFMHEKQTQHVVVRRNFMNKNCTVQKIFRAQKVH